MGYSKHKNPYHNLMHAADVTQTVHYLLYKTGVVVSTDGNSRITETARSLWSVSLTFTIKSSSNWHQDRHSLGMVIHYSINPVHICYLFSEDMLNDLV